MLHIRKVIKMRENNVIVAEYDYYTLDQARKIIREEEIQKKKEEMDCYKSVAAMLSIPLLFLLHWIVFGY